MSELSKYQRSKQSVLEMMEQLKRKSWFARVLGNHSQLKILEKDIEQLDNTVKQIDSRLAKLHRQEKDKAA